MKRLVLLALLAAPVLHAEIPQSARAQYKASLGIPATLSFEREGEQYRIVAKINVPLYKMRFESGGTIDGEQLKPSYYRDIRNGKEYASAQFSGSRVRLGKKDSKHTETAQGTVMDLFSLTWQLAFSNGKLPMPLVITNGKKLYPINRLTPSSSKSMTIGSLKTRTQAYTLRHDNDQIFLALASDLGNVPALISLQRGRQKIQPHAQSRGNGRAARARAIGSLKTTNHHYSILYNHPKERHAKPLPPHQICPPDFCYHHHRLV